MSDIKKEVSGVNSPDTIITTEIRFGKKEIPKTPDKVKLTVSYKKGFKGFG